MEGLDMDRLELEEGLEKLPRNGTRVHLFFDHLDEELALTIADLFVKGLITMDMKEAVRILDAVDMGQISILEESGIEVIVTPDFDFEWFAWELDDAVKRIETDNSGGQLTRRKKS